MKFMQLLKTEWLKFKHNAVVSLLGIMFLIFMPTTIFLGKEWQNLPSPLPDNSIFFEFPSMWSYYGYTGSWLSFFFLGLMVIFMVTHEVSYKTMRQNIINGYTRHEFFMSKLLSILALSVVATLIYTIVGIAIGYYHTFEPDLPYALNNDFAIPRFFLMTFGYSTFALFIAFAVKRTGIAIMLYISYAILIEHIIKWGFLHKGLQRVERMSEMDFDLTLINYLPMNAFEDLMPNPIYQFENLIPMKELKFDFLMSYGEASIVSIVYIIILLGISYKTFMKRDL